MCYQVAIGSDNGRMERRQLLVRISTQAHQALSEAASRQGKPMGQLVEHLILRHLAGQQRSSVADVAAWLGRVSR